MATTSTKSTKNINTNNTTNEKENKGMTTTTTRKTTTTASIPTTTIIEGKCQHQIGDRKCNRKAVTSVDGVNVCAMHTQQLINQTTSENRPALDPPITTTEEIDLTNIATSDEPEDDEEQELVAAKGSNTTGGTGQTKYEYPADCITPKQRRTYRVNARKAKGKGAPVTKDNTTTVTKEPKAPTTNGHIQHTYPADCVTPQQKRQHRVMVRNQRAKELAAAANIPAINPLPQPTVREMMEDEEAPSFLETIKLGDEEETTGDLTGDKESMELEENQ
jgi:hypothetical protein